MDSNRADVSVDWVTRFYKRYKETAVRITIDKLESLQYVTGRILGSGSFGDVIEVYDACNNVHLAAKIVLEASPGESDVWKTLEHPNVLSLVRWYDFSFASVFMTPKYEMSLQGRLNRTLLLIDRRATQKAIKWMQDILCGLSYLHERGYCHMDIKLNNILLSDSDVACIADFGFVTAASTPVNRYGAPFAYRPPEAHFLVDERISTAVDGKMFDIWTIGILCFELFTREALMKYATVDGSDWAEHFYPVIHELLREINFQRLMRSNFMWCPITYEIVEHAIHFITICLNLNPAKRPTAVILLDHPLLGGQMERFRRFGRHVVWEELTDPWIVKRYLGYYMVPYHAESPEESVSESDENMPEVDGPVPPAISNEAFNAEMANGDAVEHQIIDTKQENAAVTVESSCSDELVGIAQLQAIMDLEEVRDSTKITDQGLAVTESVETADQGLEARESSSSGDDAVEFVPLQPAVPHRNSFRSWLAKKKKSMSRTFACLLPPLRRRHR